MGMVKKPILLCILDGWGYREEKENNAIAKANTPVWDRVLNNYPFTLLETAGIHVGLPEGQMGNSEVGHMNIGGGRVVMQTLPKIDKAIEDNSIAKRYTLLDLIDKLKKTNGICHLVGLISDGGVHSHINHIISLIKILYNNKIKINIHGILDGRDVPPKSAINFIKRLEEGIKDYSDLVSIATIGGRYYSE